MALNFAKAIYHFLTLLKILHCASIQCCFDQFQMIWPAKTATHGETGCWFSRSCWVGWDSKRAIGTTSACVCDSVFLSHGIIMARSAEHCIASGAKEHSHRAAAHAFPIDKIVSVLLARGLSVASNFVFTILAYHFSILLRVFLFQCLCTVLKATKVGFFALITLIECALVHGELFKIRYAFSHNSISGVQALLNSLLNAEALDFLLVINLLFKFLT